MRNCIVNSENDGHVLMWNFFQVSQSKQNKICKLSSVGLWELLSSLWTATNADLSDVTQAEMFRENINV